MEDGGILMRSKAWHARTEGVWPFNRHPEVNEAFDRAAARLEAERSVELVEFFAWLAPIYARWADDVPASERYHHVRPFGLLIHSAETVERAFAIRGSLMDSFDPVWHRVLLTLAFLHDCGRLFDVEVYDPCLDDYWDPLQMPLHLFRETRFIPEGTPARWRAGRGVQPHEWRSLDLLPVLLGDVFSGDFETKLRDAWLKYVRRFLMKSSVSDAYPYTFGRLVAAADQLSVQADRRNRALRPPPEGPANAPVRYHPSPPPLRTPFLPPSKGA
jgi:hypothetical protein